MILPTHLRRVAISPWEIKNSNLWPPVTVYDECIYVFLIKILSSSLNTMLTVDTYCSDVCCDEFSMPQIDRKSKQVKEQCHENLYL